MKPADTFTDHLGFTHTIIRIIKSVLTVSKEGEFATLGIEGSLTKRRKKTYTISEKDFNSLIGFKLLTPNEREESTDKNSSNPKPDKTPPKENESLILPGIRQEGDSRGTITGNNNLPDKGSSKLSLF